MTSTPFHAYYTARILESLQDDDKFIPVFASSDIKVYPYQVGAALFATRSPYSKGVVLMDESGLGKSTEAMLVVTQKWYEGKSRILILVPNSDLLVQWEKLIESKYSIPFVTISNALQLESVGNTFEQDAVVLTTFDFTVQNKKLIEQIAWDITVFEEASLLSSVYKEDNKQAKKLKQIFDSSFKVLLTGTPIEKNILDLYGLMYFIDETILPSEQEYMAKYFRKTENYPELAELVSKYCFRTLRSQAKRYAKITERIVITCEFERSKEEKKLYDMLKAYIDKPQKYAFPEMNAYDLALMLFDLQGSSTPAIAKSLEGIISRLEKMSGPETELAEFNAMLEVAKSIKTDEKLKLLTTSLDGCFKVLKKVGANKKAVIFTNNRETQQYLYDNLKDLYKCYIYNGSKDYRMIDGFIADGELMITTDQGARGFCFEVASLVVNYDLLYNTLKMEQRIDRCHRLAQQNDVNMMYPRLRLAHNLLTDDGVIFISIDDNEVFNLKKVCDEVFGEENFITNIIWEKKYAPANDAKWLSDIHDNILLYAKNKNEWHPKLLPRGEEQNSRYTNRDNDPRGDWKAADMTVKSYSSAYDYPITTPSGRVVYPAQGRCWNTSKENFEKLVADNRIWFGEKGDNVPAVKKFLTEVKDGVVPVNIWKYTEVGHNQEGRQEVKKLFDNKGYFDGPKPIRLIEKILNIANIKENDIVLDFFSGSATTAHTAMKFNLENNAQIRFICVQLPELCEEKSEAYKDGYKNICEIGKERIRRAGVKILEEAVSAQLQLGEEEKKPLDVGFKVFKLDTSNLKTWDGTPIGDGQLTMFYERLNSMIDTVKDDRSDMDVVYEVMLKMGITLDTPVTYIEVNDKIVYIVGDFLLMVCLANNITAEDMEGMAAYAPAKIICAEVGFADDSALSNAHYILKDKNIELKLV